MDTQKKLYEFRCRQIINEKNQLEKNKKEHVEQKQILEEENQQLQRILQSIKGTLTSASLPGIALRSICFLSLDAFDDVTDIRAVPEAMLKIRNDHTKMLNALQQQNEQMQIENEELILNIHQQENLVDEQRQMRSEWERRLLDNEQQINELKRDIKDRTEQYERLQAEHRSYKEEYQVHQSNTTKLGLTHATFLVRLTNGFDQYRTSVFATTTTSGGPSSAESGTDKLVSSNARLL